jgi:gas vesicle protein
LAGERICPEKKENKMKTYEFEPMDATNTAKHLLTGVLVGGLIGATTMWLFAPHSGEETRNDLLDKASELRDRTTDTVKDTVDTVKDTVSQVKSKAGHLKGDVKGKSQDLKSIGQDLLVEQLDRAAEALEAAKKAVKDF